MPPIPLREIRTIVIHCSDSPNGRPQTVADIDAWHKERFTRVPYWRVNKSFNTGLTSIGYHFVICLDGTVHTGRHVDEIGAHVASHNAMTIGICMIGRDAFTLAQWASLKQLIRQLQADIKASTHRLDANVMGHYQFDTAVKQGKTCPNFDVPSWQQADMSPVPQHLFSPSPKPQEATPC